MHIVKQHCMVWGWGPPLASHAYGQLLVAAYLGDVTFYYDDVSQATVSLQQEIFVWCLSVVQGCYNTVCVINKPAAGDRSFREWTRISKT